ncbi:hypothetical protein MNBD_NITROSPINAE01-694 [hydrothermal vent metagenome]|uniref:Uncharacterized protein n=1 Tax=hydrothermal vent metagenome TaxID=652676 RepID=A0A3B1BP64_9ZZZZ
MSYRWLYIVFMIGGVSYLRYIGYKRSKRVEQKLDLILTTLGVDPEEGVAGDAKALPANNVVSVEKENAH